MKVLLIDDELHNCELIEMLLKMHCASEISSITHAYSVDEAAAILRENPVDLIFLDIQMPQKNGFQLLELFDPLPFEVIFITSFDQYALPAIQADAVAYLLKPVAIDELKRAVQKASKMRLVHHMKMEDLKEIASLQSSKIAVHDGDKVIYVHTTSILSFEAIGRYTKLTTIEDGNFLMAKNLKLLEDEVAHVKGFIRINRSALINSAFVVEYSKSEPFTVVLKNGACFELSRRKRQEILKELKSKHE